MYNFKNSSASIEEDFEFLRPKSGPPLPYSQSPSLRYQQNFYSPMPSPRYENNHSNLTSANETISNSVMFGIPRNNYPRPTDTRSTVGVDFHPTNLGSPFVDITLNNCDDLSLYQPQRPVRLQNTPQPHASLRTPVQNYIQPEPVKPILKKLDQSWNGQNSHGVYNQSLYKDGSLFKIDDNLDDESEEDDDDDENIFSTALKNLKERNKDWSMTSQSMDLTQKTDLPKFEYKSLMLDDLDTFGMNNNVSMNTKSLAAKYLNKKQIQSDDLNSQSLMLPKLDTQNLFKMYTPKESMVIKEELNESSTSSDSDQDIWLFGKPVDDSKNTKKKPKTKKMVKDFSDQDSDVDRDVTNVLDIEKLKLLPKLL